MSVSITSSHLKTGPEPIPETSGTSIIAQTVDGVEDNTAINHLNKSLENHEWFLTYLKMPHTL